MVNQDGTNEMGSILGTLILNGTLVYMLYGVSGQAD